MSEAEFTALIDQHRALLHKVANAYCRHAEDRRCVLQEIALQLWRSRDRLDPTRPASTWIYRVALNTAISFHRRERRHRRDDVADPALLAEVGAGDPDPAVERLQACMQRLDALNRALLLLWLDGCDHAAIAETMGLSTTNVATRMHRIRQQLRRCLEARPEELHR